MRFEEEVHMNRIIISICFVLCSMAGLTQIDSLRAPVVDTTANEASSYLTHQQKSWIRSPVDSMVIDSLSDQVIFTQDSVIMYCDSAIIVNEIEIKAWGNVAIIQQDTIEIFSDTLKYNSETKLSILIGEVFLKDGDETLFTDVLYYDVGNKIANYDQSAVMQQGELTLRSINGRYDVGQKKAFFTNQVEVIDSTLTMWTDTLHYDFYRERANFDGPTRINQNDAKLYCESGHYDIRDKAARLENNAQYLSDSLIASADILFYDGDSKEIVLQENAKFKKGASYGESIQIVYNEKTQVSVLTGDAYYISEGRRIKADVIEHNGTDDSFSTKGRMYLNEDNWKLNAETFSSEPGSDVKIATDDVIWKDTVENITLLSDTLFIKDANNEVKATNAEYRPLLFKVNKLDTIWMSAIEINAFDVEDSLGTASIFQAQNDVRVLSNDFQASSNFLKFHARDSTLTLMETPLMWVDSSQFMADSIVIDLVDNEPSVLHLNQNALIISESYPTVFDQIKGREITVWLSAGEIDSMLVEGNAESIYFMKDDENAFIGADKTECSDIVFYFAEGEVNKIVSLTTPTSTLVPMQNINLQELVLAGFGWYIEKRPIDLNDLKVEIP